MSSIPVHSLRQPKSTVEMLRSEDRQSQRAMILWGILNILGVLFLMVFGGFLANFFNAPKFVYLSLFGWVMVALGTRRMSFRLPSPMIVMSVLAVWLVFTTILAEIQVARSNVFVLMDYQFLLYVLCFLQGAGLVYFAPETRQTVIKIVVGFALISFAVSVLQFAKVGPALSYATAIRNADPETAAGEMSTIRASGLYANIGHTVAFSLMSFIMLASRSTFRPLKRWEMVACIAFMAAIVMVQVRSSIFAVVPTALIALYILIKRYRRAGLVTIGVMFVVLSGFLWTQRQNFGYLFTGGSGTYEYRDQVLWPQARHILRERPFTGVGIEPKLGGYFPQALANNWVETKLLDNGWLAAGSFGGYPAMTLLALFCVSGIYSSWRRAFSKPADIASNSMNFGVLSFSIWVFQGLFFGSLLMTNPDTVMFAFVLAGMAMPSREEMAAELRPRKGVRSFVELPAR